MRTTGIQSRFACRPSMDTKGMKRRPHGCNDGEMESPQSTQMAPTRLGSQDVRLLRCAALNKSIRSSFVCIRLVHLRGCRSDRGLCATHESRRKTEGSNRHNKYETRGTRQILRLCKSRHSEGVVAVSECASGHQAPYARCQRYSGRRRLKSWREDPHAVNDF